MAPGIHAHGLGVTATGLVAKIGTGGRGDKLEGKLKGKSAGGDFGGDANAKAKSGDVTIFEGTAHASKDGVGASGEVGFMVESDFIKIKEYADISKLFK